MEKPATSKNADGPDASPLQRSWSGPPVAIFWDQSLVWALICLETLEKLGVPHRLLSGAEIAGGALDHYRVLLVPGGWASHKVRALGEEGRSRILGFIRGGGSYLGFCGGAGLALSSPPSLSMVPLERVPLANRLPNASGEIWVRGLPDHPAWKGLPREIPVSIWWPSQFCWQPLPRTLCLASYSRTGSDFWVADLPVCDAAEGGVSWAACEKAYGINLDPRWMLGQPAIMEIREGRGRLILSYPHLETPGDAAGNRLFLNTLAYLDAEASNHLNEEALSHARGKPVATPLPPRFGSSPGAGDDGSESASNEGKSRSSFSDAKPALNSCHSDSVTEKTPEQPPIGLSSPSTGVPPVADSNSNTMVSSERFVHPRRKHSVCEGNIGILDTLREMEETVADLIRFGERHLLWRWRNSWLLQWRRGIRGLEYGMLAVSVRALVEAARSCAISGSDSEQAGGATDQHITHAIQSSISDGDDGVSWADWVAAVNRDIKKFCILAKRLLLEEKIATQTGNLSKLGSVNESVDRLRGQLFGNQMNHGGLCRSLLDQLDLMLLHLLRRRNSCQSASKVDPGAACKIDPPSPLM